MSLNPLFLVYAVLHQCRHETGVIKGGTRGKCPWTEDGPAGAWLG